MDVSDNSVDSGLGDVSLAGETLPECGEHQGTCARCGVALTKKPRPRFKGEARRNRATISIKVPKDEQEDGAALFDEGVEALREKMRRPTYPIYNVLKSALDYTNLNADATDFPEEGE